MKEILVSSDSPLANPGKLLREVFANLWTSRGLMWTLFLRDLKAMYRQSFLGYLWILIPPAFTTGIWVFLNRQSIVSVQDTGMPYLLYVLTGSVLWQTFSKALQAPVQAFNAGKPVFTKIKVSPEAFVASGIARVVFDFCFYSVILIPIFILMDVEIASTALFLPLVILALFLIAMAIGLLLIPVGALFADIGQGLPLVMSFLMYLSPVVYAVPQSGWVATVFQWNPTTPVLMAGREWLFEGASTYGWALFGWSLGAGLLILFSLVLLRIAMPHLVARMGM